jgi:hypothetical protein
MRRGSIDRCLNNLKQQIDKPYHLPSQEEMSPEMHQYTADFSHEKEQKDIILKTCQGPAGHIRETLE